MLVASGSDEKERAGLDALPAPRLATVLTDGARGGRWEGADGATGTWPAARSPGPPVDAYGCGDSFAAGLTYGLAAGMELPAALALAARCGAHCLTGRGPTLAPLSWRCGRLSLGAEDPPQRRHGDSPSSCATTCRLARPIHASAEPSPRTSIAGTHARQQPLRPAQLGARDDLLDRLEAPHLQVDRLARRRSLSRATCAAARRALSSSRVVPCARDPRSLAHDEPVRHRLGGSARR